VSEHTAHAHIAVSHELARAVTAAARVVERVVGGVRLASAGAELELLRYGV
jgi:hypothetical protein